MSNKRYPEEFEIEAVKQVTVAGHSVEEICRTPAGAKTQKAAQMSGNSRTY